VRHEEAWTRLPDLLDDRDSHALLAHLRTCTECQRQLFLLGRVDRLLRDAGSVREMTLTRRSNARRLIASAAAVAVVAAVLLALWVSQQGSAHEMVFRTASGQPVGRAMMSHSDTRNDSLALAARDLPVGRGHLFVLWAVDASRSPMQVGRFMVDRSGGCQVRFNLPSNHTWGRFWFARPGNPSEIVAST
jgi:anti-sigma-K factor RskA